MKNTEWNSARTAALLAADASEKVIAGYLSSGDWQVQYKADDTPVTEADVETEKAIRAVLAEHASNASFYGEETGRTDTLSASVAESDGNQAGELLWLVDPIDGTKSFIRNMPFFSTQIALMHNGELVVGVSNAPVYGERLVASHGCGVSLNNTEVKCRNVTTLSDAFLSMGNLDSMAHQPAAWSALADVVKQVRRVRGYGDFCHYHQLCCGQTDLIIESDVNILDIAALTVGVREAGGIITDLLGQAITLDTTSVLAAATPELHELTLQYFLPVFASGS